MFLDVDGAGMRSAAAHLLVRAEQVRGQAWRCDQLAGGLVDPGLRAGAGAVADGAGDVLALLAADLALLSTRVRSGALLYDQTEAAAMSR